MILSIIGRGQQCKGAELKPLDATAHLSFTAIPLLSIVSAEQNLGDTVTVSAAASGATSDWSAPLI